VAVEELEPEALRRYLLRYRATHAATSTNAHRALLRWFFGHLARRGVLDRSPAADLPRFPEAPVEARALTEEEVARLLRSAVGLTRAFVVLALETGLRRGTLASLRWEWVDLEDGWLHLPPAAMKARRRFDVPLTEAALEALRSVRASIAGPVWPFGDSAVEKRFRKLRRRAGVDCRFHDLRRTFFTLARERGVPLEIAMRLSDHKDERTALRHYRAISPGELLQWVGRGRRARETEHGK